MLACNCSALSVSPSCDPLSGVCQCQEGAIGDECDDCAFGFMGKEWTNKQTNKQINKQTNKQKTKTKTCGDSELTDVYKRTS